MAPYSTIACILSLWRDQASYNQFMVDVHDLITESNSQAETYKSVSVSFFRPEYEMPGESRNLVDAIRESIFLRVADCKVKHGRIEHFCEAQQDLWIPGMKESKGMLGGSFTVGIKESDRFLVTTLWNSRGNHERYAEEKVLALRERAAVSVDLHSITGRFIELDRNWLVLPSKYF